MNTLHKILFPIFFILLISTSASGGSSPDAITMDLPQSVINEAIQKSLPLYFNVNTNSIVGAVSVDTIHNLRLKENGISNRITLSGHDLKLVTTIAGHDIRMKIGSLTLNFQCDTTIRFDAASQTLYLRPVITEIQQGGNNGADVATALMPLFNNREFPLKLQKIQPFLTDTGRKILSVSMHISAARMQPGSLQLQLTPKITVQKK